MHVQNPHQKPVHVQTGQVVPVVIKDFVFLSRYNNQWMIVDYQHFVKGGKPQAGLLWVLEQMP